MKRIVLPENLNRDGFKTNESRDFTSKKNVVDQSSIKDIVEFLNLNFIKSKKINMSKSSYGLKHVVEKKLGRYVSNGDLIASMIICEYDYIVDGPNAYFNIEAIN
ncbi:hypothetical protein [Mesonia mobilis]|uniref:hypothetical protein n=1 Tax=Mesonia mobilis TaxID=369791 RepID=UPI0026F1C61C|nr:hypothetical protein [Mesonia mobilis]